MKNKLYRLADAATSTNKKVENFLFILFLTATIYSIVLFAIQN